jgi:hypothetical protein
MGIFDFFPSFELVLICISTFFGYSIDYIKNEGKNYTSEIQFFD